MFWLGLLLGIAVGAGGYYLYDKLFNKADAYLKAEEAKVKAKL